MFPTGCVQTRGMPCRLPKVLSSKLTFLVVLGRIFLIQMRLVHTFFSLNGFFHLDCLQSWECSLRFWNLHPSSRLTVFQERVVSVRVHKDHSAPCLLNQKLHSNLRSCWLGLLLLRVCRMDWVFQPYWGYNFCKNLESPDGAVKPFWILGISICLKKIEFYEIVVMLPGMKWLSLGIRPVWLQSGTFQLSVSSLPSEYTWTLPECSG